MNLLGGLLGWVVGSVVAVGLAVGVQYAVWGSTAPDWYAAPAVAIGVVCGCVGVMVGSRA